MRVSVCMCVCLGGGGGRGTYALGQRAGNNLNTPPTPTLVLALHRRVPQAAADREPVSSSYVSVKKLVCFILTE